MLDVLPSQLSGDGFEEARCHRRCLRCHLQNYPSRRFRRQIGQSFRFPLGQVSCSRSHHGQCCRCCHRFADPLHFLRCHRLPANFQHQNRAARDAELAVREEKAQLKNDFEASQVEVVRGW